MDDPTQSIPVTVSQASDVVTSPHNAYTQASDAIPSAVPVSHAEQAWSPPPPTHNIDQTESSSIDPMPVVKVLSVRGVEYAMLTITLWICAVALVWILLALINGGGHFDILTTPISMLIVALPVFAYLFLRRKKAELANPDLKNEPSKRRWTQITQFVAFVILLINLMTFVYIAIAHIGGQINYSIPKVVLDMVVILVVIGGILAYYWRDEHKSNAL